MAIGTTILTFGVAFCIIDGNYLLSFIRHVVLTLICRSIVSTPLLGHINLHDHSSCCEGIHTIHRISSQLIGTEGGPCVANDDSTDDLLRKSVSLVAIFSSLISEFILSLQDLRADGNYFLLKHGLDSSVFCWVFVFYGRMGQYEVQPQWSSDFRTVSRHN